MNLVGLTCVNKIQRLCEQIALNVENERVSTFTFNKSRSYNLYFIYPRKASQIHVRNLCKIYATVETHIYLPGRQTVVACGTNYHDPSF